MLDSLMVPFAYKSLKLANRFVMAPMSRYFAPGGTPGREIADYYRRRIDGGVAGVITEGVAVDVPGAVAADAVPHFHGERPLQGWQHVVDGVHASGGAFIPQLWHVGGCTDFNFPDSPHDQLVSPSGLVGLDMPGGRPMTEEDIADVIASFARAARDAVRMGCDAIELHGAHGYLFDQFFWDVTNKRTDGYGGSDIGARASFAAETVAAIREAVGPDLAIIFRVSQWKVYDYDARLARDTAEMEQWLTPLVDAGVDIFHASERRFWEPTFEGSDLNLAGWVKAVTGCPTITVGSIGLSRDLMADFVEGTSQPEVEKLDDLRRRFERGDFDLVAVGRALLSDPEWLRKVLAHDLTDLKPYALETKDILY
ncbi:NADH:flavin oxidoreductase [Sphingomonas sp. SUN019]|uniref:NADH:flavin oxidoreductase n=1 Tax=Sphingomonas sp. SUN019 TaxID=2937788 RepID=UPI0021641F0D|nr:NADH:flavin oxidoreductase [Sphingomonas sp. SUN019]UVO49709.1 NADH:flavin oxidoreductase [Sphingomonas sp. SUN019]